MNHRRYFPLALVMQQMATTCFVSSFTLPSSRITGPPTSFGRTSIQHEHLPPLTNLCATYERGSTQLKAALLPSVVTKISPPLRNTLVLAAAAVAIYKNRHRLYPGSDPDPNFSEPLPEGSLGCPLLGNLGFFTKNGTPETGPGEFFRLQAKTVDNASIFKYMALGKPVAMVSGMKNVKSAFNTEFKKIRTGSLIKNFYRLFGKQSLLFISDADRHQYLRRLVGQSMTPEAISNAMPALVNVATDQIELLSEHPITVMESALTNYTLDVAWRQILGLDLKEDEIVTFYDAVDNWIGGITNVRTLFLPGMENTKAGKGLIYLKSKIERRIDELLANGPDGSTMSYMVYAKDEEDATKSMTREEIIDNALLLILAGSETAASTLTVAMLALGLNKDAFQKLKDEQRQLISEHGEELTRSMLDKDCPYLDAVVKETMRIKPLAGTGAVRIAEETIVVDGKQIPKGYGVAFNIFLTHASDPVVKEEDGSHMDVAKGFKPERWLSDETKPTEYMPFGYGARFCLGYNLAMAEMKVFLALFARRVDYDLVNMTPDHVTWKKMSIIPKPEDGAVISVTSISK